MRRTLGVLIVIGALGVACATPAANAPPLHWPPRLPRPRRAGGAAAPASAASSPAAPAAGPHQKLAIGYLVALAQLPPGQAADLLGYFAEEGLDPEFVQIRGNSVIPALLSGELDFTTLLSTIAAHAGQGGPSKIVQFHSVKLQHVLSVPRRSPKSRNWRASGLAWKAWARSPPSSRAS